MIWDSFAGSRVGDLHRVTGTLNQKVDHSILQRHAIPSGLCLVGQGFILQQDNDPKHTSRLCQIHLRRKDQDGGSTHGMASTVSRLKLHRAGLG